MLSASVDPASSRFTRSDAGRLLAASAVLVLAMSVILGLDILPAQATLVVEIAKSQNRLFAATEDFLVTREFRDIASESQRRELLECLFAVAQADRVMSSEEDVEMRQIASQLGFSHAEYIAARLAHGVTRTGRAG